MGGVQHGASRLSQESHSPGGHGGEGHPPQGPDREDGCGNPDEEMLVFGASQVLLVSND